MSEEEEASKDTLWLDLERGPVDLRHVGDASHGSTRGQALLCRRLQTFAAILTFAGAVFLLRHLLAPTPGAAWPFPLVLVASLGVLILLRWGPPLQIRGLRSLELLLAGVAAGHIALRQGLAMADALEKLDRTTLLLAHQNLMMAAFALVVIYGLVIPNRGPRSALVSMTLVVAAYALPLLWLGQQPWPEVFSSLADLIQPSAGGAFMVLAVGVAFFGSRMQSGLRDEVRSARRMGQYLLERKIGSGGMGEVWKARHAFLARPAAVKLIRLEALGSGEAPTVARARFEREARATAELTSPHSITVFDFGAASDGCFYYAMELLDGLDMNALVHDYGPVKPARAAHLVMQACESLAEAHAAGLIHRDIKPANLFCCRLGTRVDFVKVLDFGLVKRVGPGADADLTHADAIGTPAFISPEAVTAAATLTSQCDIYALGCVLYWLVTGEYVFSCDSAMAMAVAHATEEPLPPSRRTSLDVPEELDDVIMACLKKEPEERPADAMALRSMLQALSFDVAWTDADAQAWWALHR